MKIAVLGGGMAGLAAAYWLGRSHEVALFEASDRLGGNIRTETWEECRVEHGPNGWLDNEPATLQLAQAVGIESRLVKARSCAALRFIWRAGKLRALPGKPLQFLTSDCLPLRARLRAMLEPFARKPPDGDETIHEFAARRLGRTIADTLVDAFVTGIFAGDVKRLSVRSALPRLKAIEDRYGSLLRGAKGRGFGPPGTLTSCDDGLEVFVQALADRVDVHLGAPWEKLELRRYDRVVCAVPAPKAAELADGELAELLRRIPTAPVAVVAMVFDDPLPVPDAFGFLAPRGEGLRILGTLYDSSIFPGRAPQGRRLFRTMVGGRHDPEALALDDGALTEIVARDLRRAWGFFQEPRAVKVIRHPLGIAQYERGHARLLAEIERAAPGWLRLTGSSYRGVAINACIQEALDWSP
jgi:oxygen-dependent protoporphyrinogen oxidase